MDNKIEVNKLLKEFVDFNEFKNIETLCKYIDVKYNTLYVYLNKHSQDINKIDSKFKELQHTIEDIKHNIKTFKDVSEIYNKVYKIEDIKEIVR